MTVPEFIGLVVATILREQLAAEPTGGADGTARFMLDCLSADHMAAITRTILADAELNQQLDIRLPEARLIGFGLPADVLTSKPMTYFRTATSLKPAVLLANLADDEQQSLQEVTRIGPNEIQDRPDLWIRVAAARGALTPGDMRCWEKALTGLLDLRIVSLDRAAEYTLRTRENVLTDGLPLMKALGSALPAIQFPKDSDYFTGIKERSRGHASAYRTLFSGAQRKRACFLRKLTPSQLVLSEDDLTAAFDRVKDDIPQPIHPLIVKFIDANTGWNPAAAALAEEEWDSVRPLFDGLRREAFNLGEETLRFYDDGEPALLSDDDREYLKALATRKLSEASEDDQSFFESHRIELKEDRKLKSAWDRFIFGRPSETGDFLGGLALALERLFTQPPAGGKRRLRIRCDRTTKRDLRDLNRDAGLYFARRYAGIRNLFGPKVAWEVGDLFDYHKLVSKWKSEGKEPNLSQSRSALQLRFTLELEVSQSSKDIQSFSAQLVWKYDPATVASQLDDDWSRLQQHPLVYTRASRDMAAARGRPKSVDLADARTLLPVYDRDRGSFVAAYKPSYDLAKHWRAQLQAAVSQQLLAQATAGELATCFDEFETAYTACITEFREKGAAAESAIEQAKSFAALLRQTTLAAKGDRLRELLVRPLLNIGVVPIDGVRPAAIVAPWHPLRLAAMWCKCRLVAGLVAHLLTASEAYFGDARLYFKDLAEDLSHPFFPEIVVGWHGLKPELLTLTDTLLDYTLHEAPIAATREDDDTNENPTDGCQCVIDLVQRYLELQPHEQASMSVVLFNCDSARLPQTVVDRIGVLHEDEEEVRCQVFLRHIDATRLRELYRAIVASSDGNADAFSASEATQDFMARLRICIIADQAPAPAPNESCPYDIVFSQDVIARHADIEWHWEDATPTELVRLFPARWSRRRPSAQDDMKSAVYLCCPVQSAEGWAYLDAIAAILRGEYQDTRGRHLLPTRQLDFRDPDTARIFEETHNLGNWVVNYDELLERRQLMNLNVRIIRYKQATTQGRNLIISSRAPLGLLQSMVLARLRDLSLGLPDAQLALLTDRLITDANDISGDIVLRAAKRGRNASELIGVVLSRYLIRHELGANRLFGWYFLDDYATWLGQREEQIADILALSPEHAPDGSLRLALIVSEAKYIAAANLAAKAKESQKQLRDTVARVEDAIFGSPDRLDRYSWLARLSDLILDGVRFPEAMAVDLSRWRRGLRDGTCAIYVRGYSHVFVSGPESAADCAAFAPLPGLDICFQEIFGRKEVRDLLLAYARQEDPSALRAAVAGQDIWSVQTYRRPADRAEVVVHRIDHKDDPGDRDTPNEGDMPQPPPPNQPLGSSSLVTPPTVSLTQSPTRWAYPAIANLVAEMHPAAEDPADAEWLKRIQLATKTALQQYQLQARLAEATLTPNAALLKFIGSANLTVDQVLKRRSELLTTQGLNVLSVQPTAGHITLAVERPNRQTIRTAALWSRWNPEASVGNQDLLIAVREEDNGLLILSPGRLHAPHTLIAGSTGSGKSVLMQNIILAIVATNTPAQARITLIDPKQGVDYFQFDTLPHLQGGIIDQQQTAISTLNALVQEMDDRYAKFKAARTPNLAAFNGKASPSERLPVLWLIHDEFAEWMLVDQYRDQVAAIVGRLGVKARAAGIYLVFAAQRPDANVMPMQLRANLGNRLILRVDSEGTSEIALGERGAERLLGKGHMLARLEGVRDLCYAQVPFAEPDFIDAVVAATQKP